MCQNIYWVHINFRWASRTSSMWCWRRFRSARAGPTSARWPLGTSPPSRRPTTWSAPPATCRWWVSAKRKVEPKICYVMKRTETKTNLHHPTLLASWSKAFSLQLKIVPARRVEPVLSFECRNEGAPIIICRHKNKQVLTGLETYIKGVC